MLPHEVAIWIIAALIFFLLAAGVLIFLVGVKQAPRDDGAMTQKEFNRRVQKSTRPMRDGDLRMATEEWIDDNWDDADSVGEYESE